MHSTSDRKRIRVLYVYGELMLNFFSVHKPPYDAANIAGIFLQIIMLGIAFVWGVLKVPSLVSAIFSGRSGDHAFPVVAWWGDNIRMTNPNLLLPPPAKDFNAAKQQYMKQFGSALVTNT
jgi:hypothetical protein